jgi:predicted Zn-dependent protease
MKRLLPGSVLLFSTAVLCGLAHAQDFNTDGHTVPTPETAKRAEANKALEAGEWARALELLGPLVAAHPTDALLLYDEGSAEDALDKPAAAETYYRAAIAANGSVTEPRVALGLLFAREGKMDAARAEFAEAVGLPHLPASGGDATVRARAYRAMARIDEKTRPGDARDELLEALKLTPETPEDTLLAAELAGSAAGGAAPAEAEYKRVLTARPNDPEATAGLAHLLVQQKQDAQAEAMLQTALAAHPGDRQLTAQLAATFTAEGKPEAARPLMQGLHEADPNDANVARLLAELDLAAKEYVAAEPLLATLSAANPRDGVLTDEHADALIHLKRFAEAQALLAAAVDKPGLFPTPGDLGDAAGHLAFAASENDDPAEVLRALEVRATVLPTSAPVLFLAAISHDKLRQTKLAAAAYRQFLAASNGANPDEEFQARHRLVTLEHSR